MNFPVVVKRSKSEWGVHYADEGGHRDPNGDRRAPCGVIIAADALSDKPGREVSLHPSSTNLKNVTCASCQQRIAAFGKAYAKARRTKEIEW